MITPIQACHILLLEDHADTSELLCRILRAWGHTVTLTSTVADALKAAAKGRFDLCIADLVLPDGDAFGLPKLLHGIRCIALTGRVLPSEVVATTQAGFVRHLAKPIELSALRAAIEQEVACIGWRAGADLSA